MKQNLFCYKDIETNKFNVPFFVPFGVEDTIENLKDGVIKGKIEGAKALEVYHLGSYETANGKFDLLAEPVKVLSLADYVRE